MKKKNTKIKSPYILAAQNLIRGNHNPFAALSTVRHRVPLRDMPAFIRWLPSVRRKNVSVFSGYLPKTMADLRTQNSLEPISLEGEITWATNILLLYADKISRFVSKTRSLEIAMLNGDYGDCEKYLADVESVSGGSVWILETRMALLQLSRGLEAQKSYSTEVQKSRGKIDLVTFMTHYISLRNEPSVTPFRFNAEFTDVIEKGKASSPIKSYLQYRICNKMPESREDCASILSCETNSSIVDYYETFLRLAQHSLVAGTSDEISLFSQGIEALASAIQDERLQRFRLATDRPGVTLNEVTVTNDISAYDSFVASDHMQCISRCEAKLKENPLEANLWFILAESNANLPSATSSLPQDILLSRLVNHATKIIRKDEGFESSIFELLKVALNMKLQVFAPAVEQIVWREMSDMRALDQPLRILSFLAGTPIDNQTIGQVHSVAMKEAVAQILRRSSIDSIGLTAAEIENGLVSPDILSPDGVVDPAICILIAVNHAMSAGQAERAVDLASKLPPNASMTVKRQISQCVSSCLQKLNREDELVEYVVDAALDDPSVIHMLPLSECARFIRDNKKKTLGIKISYSILLNLYSELISDDFNDLRNYAYEDFLIDRGFARPSQLDGKMEDFKQTQVIYYLRYICTIEVMQNSSTFLGTKDLEEERKVVLALLVKIDPAHSKIYESELREITRAQLIRRGVRHVEQSKIFFDISALRRISEKKDKENFSRYKALLNAGLGVEAQSVEDVFDNLIAGRPVPSEMLQVPKDEASDLLIQIVSSIFRENLTNPEHGLDCYLSMRIRHGTLSGQLRTPLELERLITKRGASTDRYEPNVYWNSKYSLLENGALEKLDRRLGEFSAEYDGFIEEFAGELVQVKSTSKPRGLFDIGLNSVRFRIWAAGITAATSFDDFYDSVTELFWEAVELNLEKVRLSIDRNLKPSVMLMFGRLESDIANILAGAQTADINRAIRTAQTGAQHAFDSVKEWFNLSKPLLEPNFPIEDLIDVGLQCVTAIHHDFAPTISREVPPLPPFAEALTLFSDIFFIIFDNIRRHSGIPNSPSVSIRIADRGDLLSIYVENQIAVSTADVAARTKVDRIHTLIETGGYLSSLSSEGGTGLIKLKKLMGRDLKNERRLDFGYGESGTFFVLLEIGKREIIA
ncbi:hypothetical protein [Agrobacterium vaccinii]|uniref:hypothetical protein n=1 Tax=Agrobacterium vaccinii TaxID=2735528 RepID=UPI001E2D1030|nr:hypothetical protein [Agrobacterium vaccinii]UHS55578.1 hypothetical protein HRS00_01455 [Agrobacterium vaccinii]